MQAARQPDSQTETERNPVGRRKDKHLCVESQAAADVSRALLANCRACRLPPACTCLCTGPQIILALVTKRLAGSRSSHPPLCPSTFSLSLALSVKGERARARTHIHKHTEVDVRVLIHHLQLAFLVSSCSPAFLVFICSDLLQRAHT